MRKLGSKTLRILRYLNQVGPVNAEGTRYYANGWASLNKLREHGLIEPLKSWQCPGAGSPVTDQGRAYLDDNAMTKGEK